MIAVWFSCGAASAVAAKLTIEKHKDVRVIYNPVANEHPDNLRFLKDVEEWIGQEIELATNPKYPSGDINDVFKARRFMSGPKGAPCTIELKKKARQHWEKTNKADFHVLGFTVEEKRRHDRFVLTERDNVLPVLIDANLNKQQCLDMIIAAGIAPPAIYALGYPNANCIGCVKASSPTYWNKIRTDFPEVFEEREKMSREYGAKLVRVKGQRIQLDELDPSATGRPLASMNIECGIFCEEKEV
jgi:3'-phosphoadenosine 5'-phosphosulfate sulfotransferase (PAPS reductase)/FAD synthetase